jgi:hypothetical protein
MTHPGVRNGGRAVAVARRHLAFYQEQIVPVLDELPGTQHRTPATPPVRRSARFASYDRLAVYPGPDFWDELRAELARTGVASGEAFDREELPWIIDRFALYWSNLEPVVEELPATTLRRVDLDRDVSGSWAQACGARSAARRR